MHTTSKRITRYKQNSRTLQTKLQHVANKTPACCKQELHTVNKTFAHWKQNSSMLQTKELHAANKTLAHCKQKNYMLQTKLPHTANKTPARCKQKQNVLHVQDDVKDPGTCSRGSWRSEEKFMRLSRELRLLECCSEITRRQVCYPCKNKCVITCVITSVILSVITHVIFYKKCESH